jgi:hypothetical protein
VSNINIMPFFQLTFPVSHRVVLEKILTRSKDKTEKNGAPDAPSERANRDAFELTSLGRVSAINSNKTSWGSIRSRVSSEGSSWANMETEQSIYQWRRQVEDRV